MKKDDQASAAALRQRAEKELKKRASQAAELSESDTRKLIHELQVHQLELEMQNEELTVKAGVSYKSEELYRSILHASPDNITITDLAGSILMVSPTTLSMFGYDRIEELLNRNLLDFIAPQDRDKAVSEINKMQQGASLGQEEYKALKSDGSIIDIEANGEIIRDTNGEPSAMVFVVRDITQRRQAEEMLKNKTAILLNLIINLQEGILLEDSNRKIALTNQLFCDMFGIPAPPEALIGADCSDSAEQSKPFFKNPDKFIADISKILSDQKPVFNDELELVDGRYFERDYIPTYIDNAYSGHLWKYRDITARRQAENLLNASEFKYRNLVENINDVIYDVDKHGIIQFVSSPVEKILGYTDKEIIGKSFAHFVGVSADFLSKRLEALSESKVLENDYKLTSKDGQLHWIRLSTKAKVVDGVFVGGSGTLSDISALKQSEDNLRKLSRAVEQSPVMTYITDLRGVIEYVNVKVLELTGYSKEELIGKNPRVFSSGEKPRDEYNILYQTLNSGKEWKGEFHNKRKNGELYWVMASISPIFDPGGNMTHYLAVEEDITDRKKAEKSILDLNAALALTVDKRTAQLAETNENLRKEIDERKNASMALEESFDRLHKIADQVPGVVYQYRLRPDGTSCFPYASEGIRDIYQVNPGDVAMDATSVFAKIHPDDFDGVVVTIGESAQNLMLWQHEYRVKFDDGTVRWVSGNAMPQREADGSVLWHGFISNITDRKQAEADLFQVSTRLALATRAARVGVWDYDIVNNILVWDDQMFALYGITKDDFSGAYDAWQAGLHPDDKVQGDKEIQMAIRGEKEFDTEFRVKWPDGTIRNIRALAVVQHDSSGKPVNLIGTNWDITAQKELETLLVQTRRNYETFFNTIDDFLFVLDEQGNMIHTNETVTRRLEFSTDELMGKTVLVVHPPERRDEAGRIVGEMLAGTADFCPVPLITKSGDLIPVETRVKTGFWDGKPVIFGVSKDISKIKLSEEKFSKAFHTNAALMAISGFESGRFIDVNETFIRELGYSREELIGKTSMELGLFDDPELRKMITEKVRQNTPAREIEVVTKTKSGSRITGLFSADLIYIGDDLCLLTMLVDITERKLAEEKINQARDEADKANLAKSEFISRMSHELRTPMNSILGFAQLMGMGELTPSQKKGVNHILSSGKYLLKLIDEVLDISRIEAGRLKLSMEPVQLINVIREVMDIVQPQVQERKLTLGLVDSPVNQLFVEADNQRLKQVLLNLVSNAIKYNRTGGSVLIKTGMMPGNASGMIPLRISIQNTGEGISSENIQKLFKPFERIGAEKTSIEGTGLGLAVAKKLVDAMGGDIGVESIPGEGSTFWVELLIPGMVKNGEERNKEKEELTQPNEAFSIREDKASIAEMPVMRKAGTILYIEDNIPNAELVDGIIRGHRPEIDLVTTMYGKDAVEFAREHHPGLILLDLDLPDLNGTEVLANLLADAGTRSIPVVILTADATPKKIEMLMTAGARDYLTKPLDIMMFLQVVDEWMGTRAKIKVKGH